MVVVPTCYEIYTDYLKLLLWFYCMLYYAHTSRVQCTFSLLPKDLRQIIVLQRIIHTPE